MTDLAELRSLIALSALLARERECERVASFTADAFDRRDRVAADIAVL